MYVCMWCMYVCMYVCVYCLYIRKYVRTCAHVCVCVRVFILLSISVVLVCFDGDVHLAVGESQRLILSIKYVRTWYMYCTCVCTYIHLQTCGYAPARMCMRTIRHLLQCVCMIESCCYCTYRILSKNPSLLKFITKFLVGETSCFMVLSNNLQHLSPAGCISKVSSHRLPAEIPCYLQHLQ